MRTVEAVLRSRGVALPAGWDLGVAKVISADGNAIVGVGTNPAGRSEVWLVIIPELSTAMMMLVGLAAMASRRSVPPANTQA